MTKLKTSSILFCKGLLPIEWNLIFEKGVVMREKPSTDWVITMMKVIGILAALTLLIAFLYPISLAIATRGFHSLSVAQWFLIVLVVAVALIGIRQIAKA